MCASLFVVLSLLFAPAVPSAWSTAVEAFARRDFAATAAALGETLHQDPDYVPALLLEARLSMMNGQMDRARAAIEHAIREDPGAAEPRFLLGFLFYLENDFERADQALAAANQKDARVLLYRAMSAEGLNHPDAARGFYERAISASAADPDARIAYARMLRKQGDTVLAAKLIDQAFAIAPGSRDVLYEKGLCLLDSGQYLQAADFGDRALAAPGPVPTEREIRYLLIRAWQKAGNPEMAAKQRAIFEKLPMPLVR